MGLLKVILMKSWDGRTWMSMQTIKEILNQDLIGALKGEYGQERIDQYITNLLGRLDGLEE